jgi:glycosyltransferase involved in cell wall biosynthesis
MGQLRHKCHEPSSNHVEKQLTAPSERMRIAYIANYQGPALLKRRPIVGNLSLAANVKIGLVAELLRNKLHSVEILSQGEVIEHAFKFYPGFQEPELFDENIPVHYGAAFPLKFVNGVASSTSLLQIFKARHQVAPFDMMIIYNVKPAQLLCANYAIRCLRLPVILEYEDDAFVSVAGKTESGFRARLNLFVVRNLFNLVSGCIGVSPHLLRQLPPSIPKLLLRGVVSDEIANATKPAIIARKNRIVFSGTLFETKGVEQLIQAWTMVGLPDWELHIAGDGNLRDRLHRLATEGRGIVFHGLLDRLENARLLCSAKIAINPHDVSETPGNVFAFKIVEYLAAGAHVISTRMGTLDPALEGGITYMPDNKAETIATTLKQVIGSCSYERNASRAALQTYGPQTVANSLDNLVTELESRRNNSDGASAALSSRGARAIPKG